MAERITDEQKFEEAKKRREKIQSYEYYDVSPENFLIPEKNLKAKAIEEYKARKQTIQERYKKGEIKPEEVENLMHEMLLEVTMVMAGEKINAGNDAIILKLDIENLGQEMMAEIMEAIPELKDAPKDSVSKLLKIFHRSKAPEEARKQELAREIIGQSPAGDLIAVPKVISSAEVELTDEQQAVLSTNCGQHIDKKIGYIIMDEVKGVDLATLFSHQMALDYLAEHEREGYKNPKGDAVRFMIRHKLVNNFNDSRLKGKDEAMRMMVVAGRIKNGLTHSNFDEHVQEMGISPEGVEMIIDLFEIRKEVEMLRKLEKDPNLDISDFIRSIRDFEMIDRLLVDELKPEFQGRPKEFIEEMRKRIANRGLLPPEIRPKLQQALNALHENRFYHCDLHERNIMIGDDGKVYLIDFGKSNDQGNTDSDNSANYSWQGERWLKDNNIVTRGNLLDLACQPKE